MRPLIMLGVIAWLLVTLAMVLSIVGLIFLIPFFDEWKEVFTTLTDLLKEE